ncbi:g7235 [Coccomyxa viridis]|uniref:2,4-dienoyl-CoA reductase [(3E)-enoyl-CoA-producing] n=1 Tax=Coccomyxa viridis TaxID=1274662 RepID=A0ABP1FXC3_9CHLO
MSASHPPGVSPFKSDILKGQVALVTGGGSGIGFEISRQLGLHGAAVAITGRRQPVLDSAVEAFCSEGINAIGIQGDVRKNQDCERWVEETCAKLGGLDILVNCAAGNFMASAEEISVNGFRTVMEINTIGTFAMSRAAFPAMRQRGGGRVVNISATLHYGATWWQIWVDLIGGQGPAQHPIDDSISVAAGLSQLAGLSKLAGVDASKDDVNALVASTVPLGKVGSKWDIAIAAVFLCSSAARHLTGDTLVMDGAAWMWREPAVPRKMVSKASRGVEAKSRILGVAPAQRSKL